MHTANRRGTWFTLLSVLLVGLFLLRDGPANPAAAGPPRPGGAVAAHPRASAALPPAPGPLTHSPPRRITVPSLRVDAPMTRVGLARDGWIEAPPLADAAVAGWYSGAVAPGERGTSVVVGHVDNTTGPAVFYLLGSLARGSRVEVLREDGRTAVFTVYGVETHPQRGFPAERVYRDGPDSELRLITCGGGFSERTGYDGNVVVFARLTGTR
ncbi:class F sortase [Streptomyces sp. NPDC055078]